MSGDKLLDVTKHLGNVRVDFFKGLLVEFANAEASTKERAKLSWISPISGRYLFVNRRGLKVADHSQVSLAAALANGRATVLESALLFDRAMDAIVEKLRQPGSDTP